MKNVISKPEPSHPAIESNSHLFDDWFDPIENMIRGQVRGLIEEMIRGELDATLSRPAEAWRTVLDDLVRRGLQRPELLIVDGGAGLESAIAAVWDSVSVQRCTVHKHRNLLAHAPERPH